MSNSIQEAIASALEAATTKEVEITYHFKSFSSDKEAYKRLEKLVEEGKLTDDDLEVIGEGDEAKLKRKSVTVKADVPVINIGGLSAEMNDHLTQLVTKQVEQRNKENIDECTGKWYNWAEVLQSPFTNKPSAAPKVTAEMVNTVVAVLVEWMSEAGYPSQAVELTEEVAGKRFSVASMANVPTKVVEKIKTIVTAWYDDLEDEDKATVEPVYKVWTTNLDKVLAPKEELDADLFEL